MRIVIALSLLLTALPAFAGTIVDVQTGTYLEGDRVTINGAVVTAVTDSGIFISEPVPGPNTGIWVYTGTGHGLTPYLSVDITGFYEEYYGASEINVAADSLGAVVNNGSGPSLSAYPVTVAQLNADPEAFESCFVIVTDGLYVTELGSYGEWTMESLDDPGELLIMDDFWEDPARFELGTCASSAIGIYWYSFGAFKLEPFAHGVCICDCAVDNEVSTFSQVKKSFR